MISACAASCFFVITIITLAFDTFQTEKQHSVCSLLSLMINGVKVFGPKSLDFN